MPLRVPRPAPPARGRAGFTLIEVVGALLVLSVGVLSALQLTTAVNTRLRYIPDDATAAEIARERIDSLRTLTYTALTVRTWTDTITRQNERWRVANSVTQWSMRLRRVQVTVDPVGRTTPQASATTFRTDPW